MFPGIIVAVILPVRKEDDEKYQDLYPTYDVYHSYHKGNNNNTGYCPVVQLITTCTPAGTWTGGQTRTPCL